MPRDRTRHCDTSTAGANCMNMERSQPLEDQLYLIICFKFKKHLKTACPDAFRAVDRRARLSCTCFCRPQSHRTFNQRLELTSPLECQCLSPQERNEFSTTNWGVNPPIDTTSISLFTLFSIWFSGTEPYGIIILFSKMKDATVAPVLH